MENQIFSHVNSIKRRSLNGESSNLLFGKVATEVLEACPIDAKDVIQKSIYLDTVHLIMLQSSSILDII